MFFDTDCAAVVHNIAYLRFIEIARTLLAEQLGMGLRDCIGPRWANMSARSSTYSEQAVKRRTE